MSLLSHKRDLAMCAFCPKMCRFACPMAEVEHREAVTPWWKMIQAERIGARRAPDSPEAAAVVYHCLSCLHCRTHCRHAVDVPGALLAARAALFSRNLEDPLVCGFLARFREQGNPFAEDLRIRLERIVPPELRPAEARAVLFAGCQALRAESLVSAARRVFSALSIDFVGVFAGDDLCCGAPLWQMGDRKGFEAHAERLRRQLGACRLVLCLCPACEETLRTLFAEVGQPLSAQVENLAEWLGPRLERRAPVQKIPGRFTYHDPCFAGRYRERYQAPRRILSFCLAEPLQEAAWARDDAACCGGGGGVPWILPGPAAEAARRRLQQLQATGAERIATACPGCQRMLGEAGGKVRDVIEVLAEALDGAGPVPGEEHP